MLQIEVGIEDVERLLGRGGNAVPLRIEGGRLIAKKLGVDVAVGPVRCDARSGTIEVALEVVDAPGWAPGRMIAKKILFGELRKIGWAELTVDDDRSAVTLDGGRLLRRLAPACADYAVLELTFRSESARGIVALRAVAAVDST